MEHMERFIDPQQWQIWLQQLLGWVQMEVLTLSSLVQFAVLIVAWALSGWIGRKLVKGSELLVAKWPAYGRATWVIHPIFFEFNMQK